MMRDTTDEPELLQGSTNSDTSAAPRASTPPPAAPVAEAPVPSLDSPELYIHRELSQLQFNIRVLEQALDDSYPLLERLKFLLIFSSNLDEFFEIRVAGLKEQIAFAREQTGPDGLQPHQVLSKISEIAHQQVSRQYSILNDILLPELARRKIRFIRRRQWTYKQTLWVRRFFRSEIAPIISPIGLDPTHPFPLLVNKSLNFIVELEGVDAFGRDSGLAIIPAPRSLPRLIRVPDELCDGGDNFVFLSSMIHAHAGDLFPGMQVRGCYQFRLTRNADLEVDPDEADDLARVLRGQLLSRRYGDAVRLEVADNCPKKLSDFLLKQFGLGESELYEVNGPVNLTRLFSITTMDNHPELQFPPFTPGIPKPLTNAHNLFQAVRKQDILLLHPYESFSPVVDMLRQAAQDPGVLAIKQTLYRTGANSEIVNALVDAARNGKEVTVVIELRARFDEESNLQLASRLQQAGAVVIYGVVGFKTHAKMMLILRREDLELRRYVHLGTGNYHAGNARLYTDYSFMTCDESIGDDVNKLFQQLTGMGKALKIKKLFHAPFTLHNRLISLIEREASYGDKGRIILKFNALTEPQMIKALYRASQAGAKVDLIIRGICCLRPEVPGLSDNIRVRSVIGRFLEHTRMYYFGNNGRPEVYCSSADGMERNLLHRVETAFPVEEPALVARLREDLDTYLADNCQAWVLQPDGSYIQNQPAEGEEPFASQLVLLERLTSKPV